MRSRIHGFVLARRPPANLRLRTRVVYPERLACQPAEGGGPWPCGLLSQTVPRTSVKAKRQASWSQSQRWSGLTKSMISQARPRARRCPAGPDGPEGIAPRTQPRMGLHETKTLARTLARMGERKTKPLTSSNYPEFRSAVRFRWDQLVLPLRAPLPSFPSAPSLSWYNAPTRR